MINKLFAGTDGSIPSLVTELRNPIDFMVGAQWNSQNGLFVGAGLNFATVHTNRSFANLDLNGRDRFGLLLRIGYHSGVRLHLPPASPPQQLKTENSKPTVIASCDPCKVLFGEKVQFRANAEDPDGDNLSCLWTIPSGTLQENDRAIVFWTAPNKAGNVPVTVFVQDGRGGSASDTILIEINLPRALPNNYVFEDVYFEFNSYTIQPEATLLLNEVIEALEKDENLRIEYRGSHL